MDDEEMPSKMKLKPKKGDYVHTAIKAAISAVPILGGPAAELFATLIVPPLDKRRNEFLEALANDIEKLKLHGKDIDIEALSKDDRFITIMLNAFQIYLRNHQEAKRELLRNAILNSALQIDIETNLQQIFLGYIESLTPLHMRVFRFFEYEEWKHDDYDQYNKGLFGSVVFHQPKTFVINNHSIGTPVGISYEPFKVITDKVSELRDKKDLCSKILKDLSNEGLIDIPSPNEITKGRVTDIGNQFSKFIRSPK